MRHQQNKKNSALKHVDNREQTIFRYFALFCCALCVVVGSVCYWFYGRINDTIQTESKNYLLEISNRIQNNIDRSINNTYLMLHTTDMVLEKTNAISFDDLAQIYEYQKDNWNFESLLLIDENGNAYDNEGNSIFLSGGAYLQDAILSNKQAMSPLQVVDGKEVSIFVVPIKEKIINGIEMTALAATFDTQDLAELLSMESFNNQAYSQIVSKDGTTIISTDEANDRNFGYNILNSIESSNSVSDTTMTTLRSNIQNGVSGQIKFTHNNQTEYMVYYPIGDTNWTLLTFIPSAVVSEKSTLLLSVTIFISVFIIIAFAFLIVALVVTFTRYQKQLENIAFIDRVTGGNTVDRFYVNASSILSKKNESKYAFIYVNLEKFKILNDKFGREVGDEILKTLYGIVNNTLSASECMCRISADNFCILLQYENKDITINRITQWQFSASEYIEKHKTIWSLPTAQFGVYIIDDESLSFPQMIDRAKLSLKENFIIINSKVHCGFYNERVRKLLLREKQLEDMMESALENQEFQMYLQPKYDVLSENIIGAEALARWSSKSEGMIYPSEFIPLFERNGFIVQLDIWMFEHLCILLRSWIDEGKELIKISINCSRIHLRNEEFLKPYIYFKNMYQIPDNIIEIELTESIVLEDIEKFKSVVEQIHQAGFGCSMDDFGSGYSSLNIIQEIPVDTLKLDKIFFDNERRNPVRTEAVVKSVISLANALSMKTVAEGIEHFEQVKMLRKIGCDYIQGYVYAKPMPIHEFEELLNNNPKGEKQ